MKTWLALIFVMIAFAQHSHAGEEIMPLDKRVGQHWNSMKIAYGTNDGETLNSEFTITRDGANKTISTTAWVTGEGLSKEDTPKPELITTPPVNLSYDLYQVIVEVFLEHLKRARSEVDLKESLAAYPEPMIFEEVRKRMAERGEIAGVEATGFIVVIFNPGAREEKYIDSFVKPTSRESYTKWIHGYRLYAAPQLVK